MCVSFGALTHTALYDKNIFVSLTTVHRLCKMYCVYRTVSSSNKKLTSHLVWVFYIRIMIIKRLLGLDMVTQYSLLGFPTGATSRVLLYNFTDNNICV